MSEIEDLHKDCDPRIDALKDEIWEVIYRRTMDQKIPAVAVIGLLHVIAADLRDEQLGE